MDLSGVFPFTVVARALRVDSALRALPEASSSRGPTAPTRSAVDRISRHRVDLRQPSHHIDCVEHVDRAGTGAVPTGMTACSRVRGEFGVLVADDHLSYVEAITIALSLRRGGDRVWGAETADELWATVDQATVVVLDWQFGEADGLRSRRHCRVGRRRLMWCWCQVTIRSRSTTWLCAPACVRCCPRPHRSTRSAVRSIDVAMIRCIRGRLQRRRRCWTSSRPAGGGLVAAVNRVRHRRGGESPLSQRRDCPYLHS